MEINKLPVAAEIVPEKEATTPVGEVVAVPVELALVTYRDEYNRPVTQLAVIGKHTVHMLDGKPLGMSPRSQRSGPVSTPLRNAIFVALAESTNPPQERTPAVKAKKGKK